MPVKPSSTFPEFLLDVMERHVRMGYTSIGSAFIDELYWHNKAHLANAMPFMRDDPFGKDTVAPEVVAFVQRCW